VRHCIDVGRLTTGWLARRFSAQGRSEAILSWMHGGLRGLALGSRVHFSNLRRIARSSVNASLAWRPAADGGRVVARPLVAAERRRAARLLTYCRRRALLGYLCQAPLAVATVPRYQPPCGSTTVPQPLSGGAPKVTPWEA
jgi:hypothetical protein